MFNEAKPIYIKHFTPPLFLIHQIFIFSSDIYRSSEIKSYRYESILSPKKTILSKKHIFKYDIHISSKINSYNKIV